MDFALLGSKEREESRDVLDSTSEGTTNGRVSSRAGHDIRRKYMYRAIGMGVTVEPLLSQT
jgi:hypothetical protein